MTRIEQQGQFAVPSFRGITIVFYLRTTADLAEWSISYALPDGPDEKTFAVGGLRLGEGMFLDGGYTEQGSWQMLLEIAQQGTSGAFGRVSSARPPRTHKRYSS